MKLRLEKYRLDKERKCARTQSSEREIYLGHFQSFILHEMKREVRQDLSQSITNADLLSLNDEDPQKQGADKLKHFFNKTVFLCIYTDQNVPFPAFANTKQSLDIFKSRYSFCVENWRCPIDVIHLPPPPGQDPLFFPFFGQGEDITLHYPSCLLCCKNTYPGKCHR